MKKYFLFLIIFAFFLTLNAKVFAVSTTPSISPKPTTIFPTGEKTKIINDLKERLASTVAQMKLVEKRGVVGTVSNVSDTQITITDFQDNIRFINVDEITKFASPEAKGSFGISDITKGSQLGILGLYNKQSRRILARFVDAVTFPKSVHGVVAQSNGEDYSLEVITQDGPKTIDIEKTTKTYVYTKDDGVLKSGFSKIKEGQNIIATGFFDIKNKEHLIATRIIFFPEIPKNPKISIPEKALIPQDSATPSTESGKKLTPITK